MIDVLLAETALPNLHAALVHFPVALVPLALLFDGRGTVRIFSARISPLRSRHEDAQHGRIP